MFIDQPKRMISSLNVFNRKATKLGYPTWLFMKLSEERLNGLNLTLKTTQAKKLPQFETYTYA